MRLGAGLPAISIMQQEFCGAWLPRNLRARADVQMVDGSQTRTSA